METTVVHEPKNGEKITLFRWQKWVDGDGRLWIVALTYGFDTSGKYGAMVELLDVDNEKTIDITRQEMELWIRSGTLKRVETPILL